RFDPERIAEPITQVPGRSCGASPPATPKLTIPGQLPNSVRASAIAAESVAVKLRPLPPQMTCLPGPAAMRASKANPTTMIKSPPAPHFTSESYNGTLNDVKIITTPRHRLITISYFRLDEARSAKVAATPSHLVVPLRLVLANLSRSRRKAFVRVLARLLTLGSGKKL